MNKPARVAVSMLLAIGVVPEARAAEGSGRVRLLGEDDRTWGIEVDAIRPLLASQLQLKATFTAWRRGGLAGEIVGGANALFGRENDDGKQTEVQAILGYRQFVWRGLHAEADFLPGWARQRSKIDGATRSAFVGSVEAVGGYRWDLAFASTTFYLLTDAGVGIILANSNEWPETSASKFRNQVPYFAGNIALGVRF